MNLIDTLERRFGRWAIPGLIRYIAILNGLVFVLGIFYPHAVEVIDLNREAVLVGQEYWRLFTYIFIPRTSSPFFIFFAIWFLFMIGDGLERAWGAFRLNLYYLVGMLGTTAAALIFGQEYSNAMLNISLYFAFAWFFPDVQIYLMLILPIRIRWMAWFLAGILFLNMASAPNSFRMATIASLANYLLFFGPQIISRMRQRKTVVIRRSKFEAAATAAPVEEPLYNCTVCKRTEKSNPELTFRVGRDGHDYCEAHLPQR